MQKQLPFWFFTAAVLIALILPTLLQDGMFMDGLLYSCVAKNMADGLGSFWFPHFSKTYLTFFDQQPPLGFFIQSLFFKLFGSSIYVERGYCFLTAVITSCLIVILWRMIFKNEAELKKSGWLPVLFWISIPVCFWAYSNGVMENTMSLFDLGAVIFIIRFFETRFLPLIIVAGIFIFFASLTKGIQGMFPLVSIFAGWVAYRSFSFGKMILYSLLLLFVPFAIYFIVLKNDSAFQSLSTYLHNRVLNSIQNVVEVESRFYLIYRLCMELIPMTAMAIIVILIKGKRKNEEPAIPFFKDHLLFFLMIGIAGSFPLIVTLEQRGFYLVNSFPYFALAVASVAVPYVSLLLEKINLFSRSFKIFRIVSVLLFAGAVAFSFLQVGKTSRDKDTIHDVHVIGTVVPHGGIVGSYYQLFSQWSFQEYLVRHYYICLDSKITNANDYVILESGTMAPDSIKLEKINIPTIRYHLYKVKR
jgi:4-amino-4-deoxy-L-arabinose transferase-like glycosyltransferase